MDIDLSLYLVTDRKLSLGRSHVEIVLAAIAGGISCIQLRDKELDDSEFLKEAVALQKAIRPYTIPLIINDRVAIAKEIEAQGLHLGQTDMPIQQARKIVGDKMIIGISAESVADAIQAERDGADYIGISPVFATNTKADTAPPLGLTGIEEIRAHTTIPLVGIGGISALNCADVLKAGCDGIAVVSAIVSQ